MVQIPLIFLSNINNSLFPLTKYSREAQVETSLVTRIFAMGCCYRFVCFKLVLALTLYKMFTFSVTGKPAYRIYSLIAKTLTYSNTRIEEFNIFCFMFSCQGKEIFSRELERIWASMWSESYQRLPV